jgi:hypothetical protein
VVWGGLAALISCGSTNPDRDITAAFALREPEVVIAPSAAALAVIEQGAVGEQEAAATEEKAEEKTEEKVTAEPSGPTLASVDPGMRIVVIRPDAAGGAAERMVNPQDTPEACLKSDACVDQYLWSIYERTQKFDTVTVVEKVKVTVKNKKGKSHTATKDVSKMVSEDFGWKDPDAAKKRDMPVSEFVIGGMEHAFKRRLYVLLHAMEDAGLGPGMTSGFRDDYRQSIASGKKAASDSSYHGGSKRGGYGRGLAADLVSVKGETRADRLISSEILWKWVDTHGQQFGIGRPYLDRDPPHVAPIDGKEYADKRGLNVKRAGL